MTMSTGVSGRTGCLLVVGLGLIGASFAKAVKAAGAVDRVIGLDADAPSMQTALDLGIVDACVDSLQVGVAQADVVLIAVPTLAVPTVFEQLRTCPAIDAVVTDASSVKGSVLQAAQSVFGELPEWLVLGHPIAGSERSGVCAAKADLFAHHKVIVTPGDTTRSDALETVKALWRCTGADVLQMTVAEHDEIFAAVSHLPHVLAYALVDTLVSMESRRKMFDFAAGGFRDFSRIASSNPQMWHDIVLANQAAVLTSIDDFSKHLNQLREQIENRDSAAILAMFNRAKAARDDFVDALDEQTKDQH